MPKHYRWAVCTLVASLFQGSSVSLATGGEPAAGEMLVGPYLEWEEFRNPNDPAVASRFEYVKSGQSSSVKRDDKRPTPAN